MSVTTTDRQRLLPFDQAADAREQRRLDRIERLLGKAPKQLTTGAKMFDYHEATKIARGER